MTQAEKSMLRYYALMTQVTQVQGDMSRTLESPANQLRILEAQLDMAGRAIGNTFIPMLNAILPYAIAAAEAIRIVANAIASLFGFAITEVDYSGLSSGVSDAASGAGDLEDAMGGAASAAKELLDYTLGFDELNVLNDDVASGGGGGGGVGDTGAFDFELPEYDFLGDAINSRIDAIMAGLQPALDFIEDNMDEILGIVTDIGIAMLAWKVANGFINGIHSLVDLFKTGSGHLTGWEKALRITTGLAVSIIGAKWSFEGGFDIGLGEADFLDYVKAIVGPAVTGVGGAILGSALGFTGVGFVIGLGVGIAMTITGLILGYNEAQIRAELESRFGDLVLSLEQVQEIALALTVTDITIGIGEYLSSTGLLDALEDDIQSAISDINKNVYKVSIGLDLTETDVSDFSTSVDKLITSGLEYITERQYSVSLGFTLAFGEGSDIATELTKLTTEMGTDNEAKFTELGERLRRATDVALADGTLSGDELAVIENYKQEMAQILSEIADYEFSIELGALALQFRGAELDPETFKMLQEEGNKAIESRLTDFYKYQASVELELERLETQGLMTELENRLGVTSEQIYAALELNLSNQELEIHMGLINVNLDALQDTYASELATVVPEMAQTFNDATDNLESLVRSNDEMGFLTQLEQSFIVALGSVSGKTVGAVSDLFDQMKPQQTQMLETAQAFYEAGVEIPQALQQGLKEMTAAGAIANDVDALYYQLGLVAQGNTALRDAMYASGVDLPYSFELGINSSAASADLALAELVNSGSDILTQFQDIATETGTNAVNNLSFAIAENTGTATEAMLALKNGATETLITFPTEIQSLGTDAMSYFVESLILAQGNVSEAVLMLKDAANSGLIDLPDDFGDISSESWQAFIAQTEAALSGVRDKTAHSRDVAVEAMSPLPDEIGEITSNAMGGMQSTISNSSSGITTAASGVKTGVNSAMTGLDVDTATLMQTAVDGILFEVARLEPETTPLMETWYDTSIAPYFETEMWTENVGVIQSAVDQIAKIVSTDTSVSSAFSNMFDDVLGNMQSFANKLRTGVNNMLKSWRSAMNSVNTSSSGTMSYSAMGSVSIPRFASGAVLRKPTIGLMAEYAGAGGNPEIVTPQNIMYDTVVAANEGMEKSREEQNQLLREQNELLRQMVEKENGVYLDGQAIYNNQQKIKRERGQSIGMGVFQR